MASSTSFDAVSNVGTRFHTQRINRRLDDRDNVIKEAIAILEEKDRAYFPTVEKIVFSGGDYSNANFSAQTPTNVTVTMTGTQLGKTNINPSTGGDTISIRLAGYANVAGTAPITFFTNIATAVANAETSLVFDIDLSVLLGSDGFNSAPAAGEIHLLQVHINECLATELFITVGA